MKATRMRIVLILTLVAGAVGACKRDDFSINLRPCNAQGRCATPYQCRSPDNVCVRVLAPNCAGGGLCPSTVEAGESCASVEKGALLPCRDDAADCRYGCRACIGGTWSDCSYCALGSDYTCSSCSDDCTAYQEGAYVYCDTAGSPQCNYSECKPMWYDADGDRTNGCECTPTAESCNGKDDDCNGVIDDENTSGCTPHYLDADGDGHGTNAATKCLCGPGGGYVAAADDCDDTVASCTTDCVSDVDGDGVVDCIDTCVDRDGDGYGDGRQGNAGCAHAETDCDDSAAACTDNCGPDLDLDGVSDCKDPCVDKDGDGVGTGPLGNTACPSGDEDDSDPIVCKDSEGDGCDDCAGGRYDPANDGPDNDADGYCDPGDCDDDMPTCNLDCTTNTDGAAEEALSLPTNVVVSAPDCLETYCGTNPASANVAEANANCLTVASRAEFNAAMVYASSGSHILINESFTATNAFNAISSSKNDITIRQRPGTEITIDVADFVSPFFKISGEGNFVEGLRFRVSDAETPGSIGQLLYVDGNNNILRNISIVRDAGSLLYDVIRIEGDDNTIQSCTIAGFDSRGVYVVGGGTQRNWITNNVIRGGAGTAADSKAAVVVEDAKNTRIVGNIIASNTLDGVKLNGAGSTYIDHNTITSSADGIEFVTANSTDTCIRNNIVASNTTAIAFNATTSWNAACAVSTRSMYNNSHNGNTTLCTGTCCSDLEPCYYGGNDAWGFTSDPRFVSIDPASTQYYCLRVSSPTSPLLEQGSNLGYDRLTNATTTSPGVYNGSAPEIGARETGVGGCPAP